jgi:methionyl-tRNA formyltransferase
MKILFMGTSAFAVPALQALANASHHVVAVVTRADKPAGRGLRTRSAPVKLAAEGLGLPVLQPVRISAPEGVELLRGVAFDLCVVAAYGQILSPTILDMAPLGCINLHGSLLPLWRGAAPIQRAILAGEQHTGVSTMWMSPGLDEGDVIFQRATPINPEETYGSLHDRLAMIGAELLVETVEQVCNGSAPRYPQDNNLATFAPPIKPEETRMVWTKPAHTIHNQVRAMNPAPGAFCVWQGKRLKIWQTEKISQAEGIPGQIAEEKKAGPVVVCQAGAVVLIEVQPEGRKRMSGGEFIRGYRPHVGEVIE